MAKELGKKTDIPWFQTHMLRHSKARWLLENGYNMSFIKDYLRHKSVRMTIDLYGHFDIEERKRLAAQGRQSIFVYD
jgi:integrase